MNECDGGGWCVEDEGGWRGMEEVVYGEGRGGEAVVRCRVAVGVRFSGRC